MAERSAHDTLVCDEQYFQQCDPGIFTALPLFLQNLPLKLNLVTAPEDHKTRTTLYLA
jgi:hypothetical protein